MPPTGRVGQPKSDSEYFDRMCKAVFSAGLNWRVIENKWSGFRKAFEGFVPEKVAKLSEKEIQALMKNPDIVRNEKKIRATVQNAKAMVDLKKEFGSMRSYVDSFGRKEDKLQDELQSRFKHVGPSSARTFLWMVGYKLTPTKEEKMWMKGHHEHDA
ncbi:MAG: DNA-3-methyladenine glycosylase I [Thaumarchaeota archaeon]|nr:DNA-3-methyladenine glycosylase I [Nitrososphaerota archaeon]